MRDGKAGTSEAVAKVVDELADILSRLDDLGMKMAAIHISHAIEILDPDESIENNIKNKL